VGERNHRRISPHELHPRGKRVPAHFVWFTAAEIESPNFNGEQASNHRLSTGAESLRALILKSSAWFCRAW
jgi:hypothetical protein